MSREHDMNPPPYERGYERGYEDGQPKWISVKDKLPEDDVQVLCCYHYGDHVDMSFISVLDYYATDPTPHFQHTLGNDRMHVTHWMPLPE